MSVEELGDERASGPTMPAGDGQVLVVALDDAEFTAVREQPPPPVAQRLSGLWDRIPGRRTLVPAVLVAFALGALLGFGTKKEWDEVRAEVAARDEVDVELTFGNSRAEASRSYVQLGVLNRGPLPVRVVGAATDTNSVSVEVRRGPREIPAGASRQIEVALDIECGSASLEAEMDLTLRVVPANGRERAVPITTLPYGPVSWANVALDTCVQQSQEPIGATYVGLAADQEIAPRGSRLGPGTITVVLDIDTAGARRTRELTRIEVPWAGSVRTTDPPLPVLVEPDTTTRISVAMGMPSCDEARFSSIGSELGFVAVPLGRQRSSTDPNFGYSFVTLGPVFQRDVLDRLLEVCPAADAN